MMIKKIILCLALVAIPVVSTAHSNVLAASSSDVVKSGINDANGGAAPKGDLDSTVKTVINLLSIAVGIAATVMVIVAGLKYTTSAGNAEKIKAAKNTLIYALVGLVIVALAQSIAHFVLTEAATPSTGKAPASPTAPPGDGAPGGQGHQT